MLFRDHPLAWFEFRLLVRRLQCLPAPADKFEAKIILQVLADLRKGDETQRREAPAFLEKNGIKREWAGAATEIAYRACVVAHRTNQNGVDILRAAIEESVSDLNLRSTYISLVEELGLEEEFRQISESIVQPLFASGLVASPLHAAVLFFRGNVVAAEDDSRSRFWFYFFGLLISNAMISRGVSAGIVSCVVAHVAGVASPALALVLSTLAFTALFSVGGALSIFDRQSLQQAGL